MNSRTVSQNPHTQGKSQQRKNNNIAAESTAQKYVFDQKYESH